MRRHPEAEHRQHIPHLAATVALLGLLADPARAACDFATNGSIHLAEVNTTPGIALGTFTRPNAGQPAANVVLSAAGVRSLPPNLTLRSDETKGYTRTALFRVTGGVGCSFRIDVAVLTGANVVDHSLVAGSGYAALTSTHSGAKATIPVGGTYEFTMGAVVSVTSSPSDSVNGSFTVSATYAD